MPRRKADEKRRTRRAETPEEHAVELENTAEEGAVELEATEVETGAPPPLPLVPEKATDGKQVYLRRPETGESQSFSKENYERLTSFVNQMPDRTNFSLFVYRMTKIPGEGVKRMYLGQIELPMGLLEDALKQQFGGGTYQWQLGKDGQFASKEDLPADTDDVRLTGSCVVAGYPKDVEEPVKPVTQMIANPGNDAMMSMLKEQIKQSQADKNSATQSMVQLMTVLLAGMQQQQSLSQQIAQQQTTFMMNLMAMHDKKSEEVSSVKDKMYERLFDLVSKMGGGGGGGDESPWGTIAKAIPDILKTMREVPGLSQVSARKPAPPPAPVAVPGVRRLPAPIPAAPAPAPVAPPGDAPIPAVPELATDFVKEDEPYLTDVVRVVWEHFDGKRPLDEAAQAVADLGTEEQFDKLLAQSNDWVANLTKTAWDAFNPGVVVPEGLLAYARAVHMDLNAEVPAIPEARPVPAEPIKVPLPGEVAAKAVEALPAPQPPPAPPAPPAAPEGNQHPAEGKDLTQPKA